MLLETNTGLQSYHNTTDTNAALSSLHPYYTYECSVAAVTVSYGPFSVSISIQTEEAGKLFT